MAKIKIGIPRGLYYYYYGTLLTKFFENLDCEVIISPKTNKEIINDGIKLGYSEMCMSLKNFIGHVNYLIDKVDYIVIPRIDKFGYNDQTCTNFIALYDIINNMFDINILNFNIDYTTSEDEIKGFIKMGVDLKYNYTAIMNAYNKAKIETMNKETKLIRENTYKLNSTNPKVLIVSHPYNIYDEYIGKPIIKILEDNDISVIYSDLFNKEKANKLSKKISKNLYFKYSKENIGTIELAKNKIDGIIFLSTFPCGPDSLANELALRKVKLPHINIIIDDMDSITGIETRIESFIDIIKERNKTCEK